MVKLHFCLVAMTTEEVAGGLGRGGGRAWLAKFLLIMQGGPLPGIRVHGLGAEGETGPACRDCKTILILFFFHSFFSPLGTLLAWFGWTLRRKTTAVTAKTMKGPVTAIRPQSFPVLHIPEQRAGRCTFNEKNIAYDIATAPPAVSAYMLAEDAAMASLAKDGYDQDHSF
uniref:Uncharacterized protein n=1 Tax=Vitis vinifera TaxID=29760 RepID=A5BKP1_VITVI|nr:hypothetical protein VITISV_005946 [Vitis vinifera]